MGMVEVVAGPVLSWKGEAREQRLDLRKMWLGMYMLHRRGHIFFWGRDCVVGVGSRREPRQQIQCLSAACKG